MSLAAERVGDRVHVVGPVDSQFNKMLLEAIPSHSMNKAKTKCTFILEYRIVYLLVKSFKKQLKLGPALKDWIWDEYNFRMDLKDAVNSEAPELPRLKAEAPKLWERVMHPERSWQPPGVAWMARAGRGLNADEPGLGKTTETIAAAIETGATGPILVLTPSNAILNVWLPELTRWDPNCTVHPIYGSREQRVKRFGAVNMALELGDDSMRHWVICNYEMLRNLIVRRENPNDAGPPPERAWPFLFEMDWSGIIADESQEFLITRTSALKDQSIQRSGAAKLTTKNGGFRYALSGTPWRGRPDNYWGTLNWLWPGKFTSYWAWVGTYFEIMMDADGGTIVAEVAEKRKKLYHEDLDATMLRRTVVEVAPTRPARVYPGEPLEPKDEDGPANPHGIWLDMDPKQDRIYKQMKKEALARIEGGELLANSPLAEIMRLRQFAASYGELVPVEKEDPDEFATATFRPTLPSNKFDWLVAWLDERGITRPTMSFGDSKIVVASQFTKLLMLIKEGLDKLQIETGMVYGRSKTANRADMERFQDPTDPMRVLLINTKSGGTAITLDIANEMVVMDETWIPDDMDQLERRIDRVAGDNKTGCQYWYVRSRGTVEEHIATLNTDRRNVQGELLDGRRGVSLARRLVEGH